LLKEAFSNAIISDDVFENERRDAVISFLSTLGLDDYNLCAKKANACRLLFFLSIKADQDPKQFQPQFSRFFQEKLCTDIANLKKDDLFTRGKGIYVGKISNYNKEATHDSSSNKHSIAQIFRRTTIPAKDFDAKNASSTNTSSRISLKTSMLKRKKSRKIRVDESEYNRLKEENCELKAINAQLTKENTDLKKQLASAHTHTNTSNTLSLFHNRKR
jgi:hypothetical protein